MKKCMYVYIYLYINIWLSSSPINNFIIIYTAFKIIGIAILSIIWAAASGHTLADLEPIMESNIAVAGLLYTGKCIWYLIYDCIRVYIYMTLRYMNLRIRLNIYISVYMCIYTYMHLTTHIHTCICSGLITS
jgi:hypothetical protein